MYGAVWGRIDGPRDSIFHALSHNGVSLALLSGADECMCICVCFFAIIQEKISSLMVFIPFQSTAPLPFRVFIAVGKYQICTIQTFAACFALLCFACRLIKGHIHICNSLGLDLHLVAAQL